METLSSKQHSANGSVAKKKENIAKNYSVLPKDSLVSKEGVEADFGKVA